MVGETGVVPIWQSATEREPGAGSRELLIDNAVHIDHETDPGSSLPPGCGFILGRPVDGGSVMVRATLRSLVRLAALTAVVFAKPTGDPDMSRFRRKASRRKRFFYACGVRGCPSKRSYVNAPSVAPHCIKGHGQMDLVKAPGRG